eukprot:TRINITY_DN3265_c0_g1_i1.p1 TRINITY_DN3265_c0_g1~~TRINITY_DN3265_c0_g1_i1.p1  ORF type:complete len:239 (-),score=57.80 TRINITY_DN3265_c0_g1_i1:40-756(-)
MSQVAPPPPQDSEETVGDNLYITGFPIGSSEEFVKQIFSQYGTVVSVKVLPSKSESSDAACMVRMETVEQAKWLIERLNNNIPQGMSAPVTVKPARSGGNGWGGYGGKGWGGYGGYGGYGWGMNPWMAYMMMMKGKSKGKGRSLHDFPPEKKVWVGNLDESVTFRDLHGHFEIGQGRYAVVMKGKGAGTGGVAFQTAEEAAEAIQKYNGSTLAGKQIQVDAWTRKEKPAEAETAEPAA